MSVNKAPKARKVWPEQTALLVPLVRPETQAPPVPKVRKAQPPPSPVRKAR